MARQTGVRNVCAHLQRHHAESEFQWAVHPRSSGLCGVARAAAGAFRLLASKSTFSPVFPLDDSRIASGDLADGAGALDGLDRGSAGSSEELASAVPAGF